MSKLIYVASPYSHPSDDIRENNFRDVSTYTAKIVSEGFVALSPITFGHTLLGFSEMPSHWEFWKNFCISFLEKCDELHVYMMPGWDVSRGVSEEIEYATENGIPVVYVPFGKNNKK
jgi:hypothetical protein